jgi:hypothetical protein
VAATVRCMPAIGPARSRGRSAPRYRRTGARCSGGGRRDEPATAPCPGPEPPRLRRRPRQAAGRSALRGPGLRPSTWTRGTGQWNEPLRQVTYPVHVVDAREADQRVDLAQPFHGQQGEGGRQIRVAIRLRQREPAGRILLVRAEGVATQVLPFRGRAGRRDPNRSGAAPVPLGWPGGCPAAATAAISWLSSTSVTSTLPSRTSRRMSRSSEYCASFSPRASR